MNTAAATACAALVLAAFPSPGAGQPAAAQRAHESGKASAPLVDVAQPPPAAAAAKAAPWASSLAGVDAHQLAHQIHEMIPSARGETSAHNAIARIEAELRRAARTPPMWADHSHDTRTAQLRLNLGERGKRYRAERRAERRRRMQGNWADSSDAAKDASVAELLGAATAATSCDDPLATNAGQAAPCVYDCQTLQREYFPGEESRCFLFDPASGTWPESGGQGAELLSMRQQRLETETFVSLL